MIETIEELDRLYGAPKKSSLDKVTDRVTGAYARWIEASRFAVIASVGPEGTDASPRGDAGPVARRLDDRHLAIADWRGNNRIDTLRNIVRDPRVSIMFMVPGSRSVVRVNGRAYVTTKPDLIALFDVRGRHPVSVIVIEVAEIYSQCPKSLIRSELWTATSPQVPTPGQMLADASDGEHGGPNYDGRYDNSDKDEWW